MKKAILILLVSISTNIFSQTTEREDLEVIQGVYGKSKKELAIAYMDLPEAQSATFWKLYDAFEMERKELGKTRIGIINSYSSNYATFTDESVDKIAKASLKNHMDYQKLLSKYYGKYKKAVGALSAAKIMQFENYMITTVQSEIQNAIPFIDKLDSARVK